MISAWDIFDFREVLNGTWFMLNLILALVFGRFVLRRWWMDPGWYADWNVRGCIALMTYFAGSTILRGWVWLDLLRLGQGDESVFSAQFYTVPMIAAFLGITGALCAVRVFLPANWSNWVWIGAGIAAVGVPTTIHLITG